MQPLRGENATRPDRNAEEWPELDQFLAQIGYGHYYRPDVAAGPAPESDPSAQPEVPVAPPPAEARAHFLAWTGAGFGALILAGMLLVFLVKPAAGKDILDENSHYAAAPFFTLNAFHKIDPGMDADGVRNLIGFPLRRYAKGMLRWEEWVYTQPGHQWDRPFPLCTVIFVQGRVCRTRQISAVAYEPPKAGPPLGGWTPGLLRLVGDDGACEVLSMVDPTPWILVHAAVAPSLPLAGKQCVAVRNPGDSANGPYAGSRLVQGISCTLAMPKLSVYSAGTLYTLPVPPPGAPQLSLQGDLNWLLSRLRQQ